jgi:hypothetical protein
MAKKKAKATTVPSSRVENMCSVPGCHRELTNKKRGLCVPCASSFYYFSKKKQNNKHAISERQQTLRSWVGRMDWLFEETK